MPALKVVEVRPRRFFYSETSDADEVTAIEESSGGPPVDATKTSLCEHELYPLLSAYLWTEHRVYSVRISESTSSNNKGKHFNRWLHPDVVGMEDLGAEWHPEVRDCVRQAADKRTRLWSFEVKVLINRSNVRECFFQAVSNSSWANFGYLVASEIQGDDTAKELRMLFGAHGIGVIRLDTADPSDRDLGSLIIALSHVFV